MAVSQLRGRRGVFFTIMSLLIIIFLISNEQSLQSSSTVQTSDTTAAMTRINVLNNYLKTFRLHAAESLGTAGYFTLQNLSGQIRKQHQYLPSINASVTFCMNNQTNPYNCLSQNETISASIDKLVGIAQSNFSINTTYNISNVWVSEETPFEVIFWMNLSYSIHDPFASWTINNDIVSAIVDVNGIEDPAYAFAVGNNNLTVTRSFNASPFKHYQLNTTTFTQIYGNRSYISMNLLASNGRGAPSVLQRYEGKINVTSSCCGIESIIRYDELNPLLQYSFNPQFVNWSFVDYYWFTRDTDPTSQFDCAKSDEYGVANITTFPYPIRIRIDTHHIYNIYNLTNNVTYTCTP